jgi:hypothetical protein
LLRKKSRFSGFFSLLTSSGLKISGFHYLCIPFYTYLFNIVNVLKLLKYSMLLAKKITTSLACACFYYVAFTFNRFIFDEYAFSFGVHWIFIPSGLQLVLVLTAVVEAALGIAIASWLIGFQYYYLESDLNTIITGIITGASPLLARKISFDWHSPKSVDKYYCQNLNWRNANAKSQIHT